MNLSEADVVRFYAAWLPLLGWVNEQRQLLPGLPAPSPERPIHPSQAVRLRDALWADDDLRHAFVGENPAKLAPDLLALIQSWDHRVAGTLTVYKHLKRHSVFLSDDDGYGVLGLYSPLDEVLPFAPILVKAVLLPFGDRIVTDGLIESYNVYFGPGIRRSLLDRYRDLTERRALQTSLLPQAAEVSQAKKAENRQKINEDVLRAFRQYLLQSGRSEKITARDLITTSSLGRSIPDRSLRECTMEDLLSALRTVPTDARKDVRIGLERFVQFLRDTERMGWQEAEQSLVALRAHR